MSFSDTVRPALASKGASLDKDDLTEGLKQDQRLHELIASEHNNNRIISYAGDAFPDVGFNRNVDPTLFRDIDWQKSKEILRDLSNEYDKSFYNWKQSGFHGEFPEEEGIQPNTEKVPFLNFTNGNKSLQYMHRFVFQFPECLSHITGK